jgi:hypothetical protein
MLALSTGRAGSCVGGRAFGSRDDDGDGIDDAWERQNGLDPTREGDGRETHLSRSMLGVDGYTNLEVPLHELASARLGR